MKLIYIKIPEYDQDHDISNPYIRYYENVLWRIECLIKITSGKNLILEICVSDFTLARAELLASMALYPINEFAAKETCRGAEIESDAVVYRAIVDPE